MFVERWTPIANWRLRSRTDKLCTIDAESWEGVAAA
jgi:hypothetical protein